MNLDELQSVQSKERQASDLQHLRPSFYAEAAEFVRELRDRRQHVVAEEGLDAPEFERLTDDIKTAERAVESIYERRVGKVVKKASIAAADMPTDDEGLTDEERDLFETLVADIRANRDRILSTLDDDASVPSTPVGGTGRNASTDPGPGGEPPADRPDGATDDRPDGTTGDRPDGTTGNLADDRAGGEPGAADPGGADRVDAADLMAGDVDEDTVRGGDDPRGRSPEEPAPPEGEPPADSATAADREAGADRDVATAPESAADRDATAGPDTAPGPGGTAGSGADGSDAGSTAGGDGADVDRTTVRITRDVGEILGVDKRAYHLASEDVVTLPEPNAEPLLERGAAERIE